MKKKSSLGCLFWVALALLVVVVFLYNRERINRVLASSGLLSEKTKPEVTVRTEKPRSGTPAPPAAPVARPDPRAPATPEVVIRVPAAPPPQGGDIPSPATQERVRKARIFFVQVNQAGDIALQGVIRSVPYTDSPLKETLVTLLDGQAARELSGGLLTMIPANVKLRDVYVKGSTAFVDVSDEFRFNSLGRAGLLAQIRQLVYTATEFSNVKTVQVLVEGRQLDYLSSEGPYIGKPISRDQLIKGLL